MLSVREEIIEFLTALMRNQDEDARHRLKAAELLKKFEEGAGGEETVAVSVEYL